MNGCKPAGRSAKALLAEPIALTGNAALGAARSAHASTYIFGAICPGDGKGAALVLPACNTEAMNLHLAEIATEVAPGKHAVLVLDQAGWHLSARLAVPGNVTLIVLPPKCPELNPAENVWQTVCSLPKRRWLVPRYATNEGCAGWTGVEPHAEGTSHAPG